MGRKPIERVCVSHASKNQSHRGQYRKVSGMSFPVQRDGAGVGRGTEIVVESEDRL